MMCICRERFVRGGNEFRCGLDYGKCIFRGLPLQSYRSLQ